MALTNPGITMAVHALFANIKPALDLIEALGPTDFSAEEPGVDVKPGTTVKYPLSVVSAALRAIRSAPASSSSSSLP